MARRLWAVANATGVDAALMHTQEPADGVACPANAVTHTGGKNDDYIKIPDCSSSDFFAKHHISIAPADTSWTVCFWNDDKDDHSFQWSPENGYSTAHDVAGSGDWEDVAVVVKLDAKGNPVVYCAPWS